MRERRNVWDIENDDTDETLRWYGEAIGRLKARPLADPRSWYFQAAVHGGYDMEYPQPTDDNPLPRPSVRQKYWQKCQHGSWFFLPWHRMYLHFFEEIIAAEVKAAGGPDDWALPYWNYSADPPTTRLLPPSFRSSNWNDGSTNHLFTPSRRQAANAGEPIADPSDVDLSCLTVPVFSYPGQFGPPDFGGGESGVAHNAGRPGELERIPHGSMHVAVGGWMGRFATAGLDPIFWVHHCNIDRLWSIWLKRSNDHVNPSSSMWRQGAAFDFHDQEGQPVTMRCRDVEKTDDLGYIYDDISDPLDEDFGVEITDLSKFPQLIGATEEPFRIDPAQPSTRTLVSAPRAADEDEEFGITTQVERVYLHLENLTAERTVRAIDVYFGVSEGEEPSQHPEKKIGRVPLFGIAEASSLDGNHAGSGLTFSFDITKFVTGWDEGDDNSLILPVSFVPIGDAEDADDRGIRVGRMSLYAE